MTEGDTVTGILDSIDLPESEIKMDGEHRKLSIQPINIVESDTRNFEPNQATDRFSFASSDHELVRRVLGGTIEDLEPKNFILAIKNWLEEGNIPQELMEILPVIMTQYLKNY